MRDNEGREDSRNGRDLGKEEVAEGYDVVIGWMRRWRSMPFDAR